jgi:hypothetical protein
MFTVWPVFLPVALGGERRFQNGRSRPIILWHKRWQPFLKVRVSFFGRPVASKILGGLRKSLDKKPSRAVGRA